MCFVFYLISGLTFSKYYIYGHKRVSVLSQSRVSRRHLSHGPVSRHFISVSIRAGNKIFSYLIKLEKVSFCSYDNDDDVWGTESCVVIEAVSICQITFNKQKAQKHKFTLIITLALPSHPFSLKGNIVQTAKGILNVYVKL